MRILLLSSAVLLLCARGFASQPGQSTISGAGVFNTDNSIQWTWTAAAKCSGPLTYTFIDATGANAPVPNIPSTQLQLTVPCNGPNTRCVSAVQAVDNSCSIPTGPLSNSVTVYTFADAPTAPSASSIQTASALVSWTTSNPSYTRFEVSTSLDNFGASNNIVVPISQNLTGNSTSLTGLSPGTTYFFRVRAFNGQASDNSGTGFSGYSNTVSFVSQPSAPALTGAALSTGSIKWTWSQTTGAAGYRLYESNGGPLLIDTPGLSYSSGSLTANGSYGLVVYAYTTGGILSAPTTTFSFPLARVPASPGISTVTTNSVAFTWNPNGNSALTSYESFAALDSFFNTIIATAVVTQSTAVFQNLFPGSTYFFKVHAINGSQIATLDGTPVISTITLANPSISQSSAPATPYTDLSNVTGLWHFDVASASRTPDSSIYAAIYGDSATLTCLDNACVSTPTFVAGPPNLGTAVNFQGLTDSLVLIQDPSPSNPPFDFNGSISIGAWVKPGAAVQPDGAGIVVKGNTGGEDFSLEYAAPGLYRIKVGPASVVSTGAIVVGQWTHVMAIYDNTTLPATPSLRLYVNGVLTSSTTTGIPLTRSPNSHAIAIGSKQSCLACALPYDLAFKGAVDEVRLVSQALTDAQVAAEFQSASTSTVVPPLPNSPIQIFLPPNAFPAQATIFVSTDPVNNPLKPGANFASQGLQALPTGQILIPGTFFEIVPVVGGVPFSAPLGSSATLAISYQDDGSGNVLGLNPPVAAASLVVYTLDTTVLRWNPLPTTVDTVGRKIYALTPHFSLFGGLGVSSVGTSLTQVFAFPSPWKIGSKGKFDAPVMTFANLPANGLVKIFNLAGELIKTIPVTAANSGKATWDGGNVDGKPVAAGVYLAYIQVGDTTTGKVIKFAIEK